MLSLLIVSVNYSDYLKESLLHNIFLFDTIYIVTSPKDTKTVKLVNSYKKKVKTNIRLIVTDIFYKNNKVFNKGGAINYALSKVKKNGWIIIGDSDIIYPPNIQDITKKNNKHNIYGLYRYIVDKPSDLPDALHSFNNKIQYYKYLKIAQKERGKIGITYVLGYCQLFNFDSKYLKDKELIYPDSNSCKHVDVEFARMTFPYKRRRLLNEYCLHLGSTEVNWYGRVSNTWGA